VHTVYTYVDTGSKNIKART